MAEQENTSSVVAREVASWDVVRKAFNSGRVYDCGRVPPLPKRPQKHRCCDSSGSSSCSSSLPFTLLSFLTSSHTNKRREAFSKSGWRKRIERGQISVDGIIVSDPGHVLSNAKQRVEYHRFPWKEPILAVEVAASIQEDEDEFHEESIAQERNDARRAKAGAAAVLKILHIDDHLLVVDKPSGLPTMPSQTYFEYSILNALRRLYGEGNESEEGNINNINIDNKNKNQNNSSEKSCPHINVFASTRARKLIRSHCSAEPQPVHRLGVGTSGVLVLATSLLGRQKLTDAIRFKSHNSTTSSIRKVYRALVYARRCDDRTHSECGIVANTNTGMGSKRNGPCIPDVLTIDCPIGMVPFPIGGDSIHAACPVNSESLYGHVHVKTTGLELVEEVDFAVTSSADTPPTSSLPRDQDSCTSTSVKTMATTKKKKTTKPALSHVRVLCRKNIESFRSTDSGNNIAEEAALVEVEIPTGRPHQIRIHMAYAGYPLVGDPLYLPGGIPDTVPRYFESVTNEEEDMETDTDDENEKDCDGNGAIDERKIPTAKTTYVKRVALPRDCGYHLHAHRITLEHPCPDDSLWANSGNAAASAAGTNSDSNVSTTTMTFTALPPPLLREERTQSVVMNQIDHETSEFY